MASKIKRDTSNGAIMFNCPACNSTHCINFHPTRMWTVTGTDDKPTFYPSVSVTTGRAVDPTFIPQEGDPPERCHSYVTDGRIQFLDDCTHALKGQTVDLPDWDGVK